MDYMLGSVMCQFTSISVAQGLQLLKILWKGSAVGLSLTSALLQLYALSCPVLYAMANNFPLLYVGNEIFGSRRQRVVGADSLTAHAAKWE